MAEMIIMLRRDPDTGKQNIIIKLNSDADALPIEHEQLHRELVEKLIGKENVGKVIVERETEEEPAPATQTEKPVERQKQGQKG
jgi:hypothetical protein